MVAETKHKLTNKRKFMIKLSSIILVLVHEGRLEILYDVPDNDRDT